MLKRSKRSSSLLRCFVIAAFVFAAVVLASAGSFRKLPTTLKVRKDDGSIETWKVTFVKKPMCMAGDTGAKWGITNCNHHTLRLWTGMTDEQMADIFVHESMHIVTGCVDRDEDLHSTIYELAPTVRRLLRDNPKWAEFVLHAPVTTPLLQYGVGPVDDTCAPAVRTSANTITITTGK